MTYAYDHLVFRGDQYAYGRRNGRFPYLEHAAAAGANGVHVWFWGDAFRAVAADFFACCRELGLGVHLGIGIGAYGVCDGEDPLAPGTVRRIRDHITATLDEFDIAGIEFQTGEYDKLEFRGPSVAGKARAEQLCEHLNPYIDHALTLGPGLWLRTELHAGCFPPEQMADVARNLDARCTVEWSQFTGPFRGPDRYRRGGEILALGGAFSWFLKINYNRQKHWREVAADASASETRKWAEHWQGWVRLLAEYGRRSLTICDVGPDLADGVGPFAGIAVAVARDPYASLDALLTEV